ncbi:MAG: hypothetical protein HY918_03300 [Candidatus Doudnabacteria bacterium]|nr:hypothetical protein [Candidatus Doudnabacteria bacterium]
MNEKDFSKLEGLCPHGNNPASCGICEKHRVAGTLKNKVSNFVRTRYKKYIGPTVARIDVARGKPNADTIARQLENSEPFDVDKFLSDTSFEERGEGGVDKFGELKDRDTK